MGFRHAWHRSRVLMDKAADHVAEFLSWTMPILGIYFCCVVIMH